VTTLRLAALAAGTAFALAAAPASAQLFARPPADVPQAVQGPDVAAVGVRVERLEGQIRTLTGQIEQLQNRNRQLEEQMKRFQQDVEFRFQEQGGRKPVAAPPAPAQTPAAAPGRRSSIESAPVAAPQAAAPQNASPQTPAPQVVAPQVAAAPSPSVRIDPSIKVDPSTLGPFAARAGATGMAGASGAARPGRNDAFDPAANPAAPGAPRPLGATRPSAPLSRAELAGAGAQSASVGAIIDEPGAGAPLDLANPRPVGAPPASEPRVIAAPAAAGGAPAFDAAPLDPARADYDHAMIAYRNGQYDTADALLRQFVQKHPADRMVADAVYFRGETLAQRGRNADAAEQFLKVTTDFSQSSRAPDAMLKLGQSLKAMGEKEQACATFAEIPRKHPRASGAVKGAEREMKRNAC
jgi:tol-pal system protein YbgF